MGQSIDANLNAGASNAIFQRLNPVSVGLGHPNEHDEIVVYTLQLSSLEKQSYRWGLPSGRP